jgi:hypothetical protein
MAVVTLALGIGACTAIFSVVKAVLIAPLPFPEADRLVALVEEHPKTGPLAVAPASFVAWRGASGSFDGLVAFTPQTAALTGAGDAARLAGCAVSDGFFALLGARFEIGRGLSDETAAEGGPEVVVSDGLWRGRFGADPALVGRTLALDGTPFTVVGIAEPGFRFPEDTTQYWTHLPAASELRGARGRSLRALGRLKADVSRERAGLELTAITRSHERDVPESNRGWSVRVERLKDVVVGGARRPLEVLSGAAAILMLIAFANVASLLLARAIARRGELAVRARSGRPAGGS